MAETAGSVLVLNSLYQAVQVTGVRRAFRLFYAGRARAVAPDFASYDFDNWCDLPPRAQDEVIHTPTRAIRIPKVIQLIQYDRLPSREIRFTRRNIFYRDKNRCQYCGQVFRQKDLNLDHVVPLSRGGKSNWGNVVCACIPCNTRKGDRTPVEAHMRLVRRPKKPAGHPMLRANWIGPCPDEWKTFLDEAYWNVELHDDVMLHRADG
ncbi:MAG TPA: HNH endonuclease [Candidatus Polarisedimenticolaceae bacterium]|nr:HNH endonuclease [Candidatus Polarisedimenticolaceae bacterium]